MFGTTTRPFAILLIAASLLFMGTDAALGRCYKGSSSSAASDYPPIETSCDIHPDVGEGATNMVCFVGKVKDLNYYSMSCMTATNCNREKNGITAGTNQLYESVVCCTEVDNCNDYEDIVEDGSNGTPSTGASLLFFISINLAVISYVASDD